MIPMRQCFTKGTCLAWITHSQIKYCNNAGLSIVLGVVVVSSKQVVGLEVGYVVGFMPLCPQADACKHAVDERFAIVCSG